MKLIDCKTDTWQNLFCREPIVPVIKIFWNKPFKGIYTGSPEEFDFPKSKEKLLFNVVLKT